MTTTTSTGRFFHRQVGHSFSAAPNAFFRRRLGYFGHPPIGSNFVNIFCGSPLQLKGPGHLFKLVARLFVPPLRRVSSVGLVIRRLMCHKTAPGIYVKVFHYGVMVSTVLLFVDD